MRNGLPYYKAYPRDFIEGTIGMPFEVKCAYRVVLDMIYMQSGKLPDDARYISGLLGCSIRKWRSIREALVGSGKVKVSGEFIHAPILAIWKKEAAKSETRPAISTGVIRQVMREHGYVCFYCNTTEGPFEIDHITPWSRGGGHSAENLVVACRPCNRSKGAKTLDEWEGRIQ